MKMDTVIKSIYKKTPVWFRIFVTLGIIIVLILFPSLGNESTNQFFIDPPNQVQGISDESTATVTDVVDGDTIKVKVSDKNVTVRIANINAPESVHPRKPVECMGKEASKEMEALVLNQEVILKQDSTQQDRDRYGRLIRYVFIEKGNDLFDVGLEMISQGYAYSSPYGDTPHAYLEEYSQAEKEAQDNNRGLWDTEKCPT